MRSAFFSALVGVACLVGGPALAADPTGLWQTATDGGQVEITKCGNTLCGRLVMSDEIKANPELKDANNKDAKLRGRTLKGLTILTGFVGGPREWIDGSIYNAEDGKTYSASIVMADDNTLKVRGCVFEPFCQTQTWTRLH